ncbi:MAG: PD-(D/E)XK nuclease family protein [Brumimicrobium sp.]
MQKFIDKIAQYIYENDLPLEDLTIVLPSQRARKYLQKALFETYKKPIFSPNITTISYWIQNLSDYTVIDSTQALFKLYEIHLKVDKEEQQSFDEFLKWGQILLSDFDEIDRYLINSKDLFKNLAEIKEIENWSFGNPEELTDGQKRFMRFWDLLGDYYREFNQFLSEKEECYLGSAFRNVAKNVDVVFKENKNAHFVFAGFNALSPAEISIMKQLYTRGRADIFIDADEFYIEDRNHEAGRFIRDLLQELNVKTLPFIVNSLKTDKKDIEIINCPQPTGQAKVSASILNDKIPKDELSETLLLLGDENMIVPVIKNIPKGIGDANITLGLPLKNTSIKSWADLLFNVQERFKRFNHQNIYHKDFIGFIKHPFIQSLCNVEEKNKVTQIEQRILDGNLTFIYKKNVHLGERLNQLLDLFFTPWNIQKGEFPITLIQNINQIIFNGLDIKKNDIERSLLYNFNQSISKLGEILDEYKPDINLGTFKSLFNQHWTNKSIAYYGNPLDGLQVMGLLETRLIDFKNIIVIGLNDGNMPPTNPIQSMIMMDLRRYHNLPTPREKQGLFAHHFYRLLHTAKRCWITYSSANREGMGMDEPSRYIAQLQLELAKVNPNINIHLKDYIISNEKEDSRELVVEKTDAVIERLDNYLSTRTSASALRTAMRCTLDFYYKYLLGLGEEDKVEEEIEANTFGNFIHKTLQILYDDYAQFDNEGNTKPHHRSISAIDVVAMRSKQPQIMTDQFYKFFNYNDSQKLEGKNYLSLEIAQHLTDNFLKKEEKELKESQGHFFVTALEMEITKELSLSIFGDEKNVRFIGVIDRIDDVNGEKRILDYKSGKCTESDVRLYLKRGEDKEDLVGSMVKSLKSSKYIFQLLVYIMLYHEKFGTYPDKVGIISMVNLKESPFYLKNELTSTTEDLMRVFKQALIKILEDLYDKDTYFKHSSDSQFCGFC